MSINIGPANNDKVICELSDSDHFLDPHDLITRAGFSYIGTEVRGNQRLLEQLMDE